MKVAAYWNLHKNIFSIQSREKENYGKVIAHKTSVAIASPKFVVRQTGREKVLKEKSKNVHAFIVGHLLGNEEYIIKSGSSKLITYNPYKFNSFVTVSTNEQVKYADLAELNIINDSTPVITAWNNRS